MLRRPADDCFANRQGLHSHEKTMTFKDWCDGRLRTRCFHPGYDCAHHIILSVLGLWTESHEPSHTACISATCQHRICAWPSWSDFSPVFPERFLVWLAVNPIAVLQLTKQDINKAIVHTFYLCASSLHRGVMLIFSVSFQFGTMIPERNPRSAIFCNPRSTLFLACCYNVSMMLVYIVSIFLLLCF